MHSGKILFLLAVCLLCTNARIVKKKLRQRVATPSCGRPLTATEPACGCFGTCSCQNIFLDKLSCGCQYVDTYGVLNPELPNGRIPVVNLPSMPINNCDTVMQFGNYEVLPAIHLPGLYELPQTLPLSRMQCTCQAPMTLLETPYGSIMQSPILQIPAESCVQAPLSQPQIIRLPSCGCQNVPCSCQSVPCSCQNSPCNCQNKAYNCQNKPCSCQNMPCSCQKMPRGCQNVPCSCQSVPCSCQSVPCSCQNIICECQNVACSCQNTPRSPNRNCKCNQVVECGPQYPTLELACACQSCQLSPLELPASFDRLSLPSPVIGCTGKYLRQVVIQPPFL